MRKLFVLFALCYSITLIAQEYYSPYQGGSVYSTPPQNQNQENPNQNYQPSPPPPWANPNNPDNYYRQYPQPYIYRYATEEAIPLD